MENTELLKLALSRLKKQKTIYQPTDFWANACEKISKELMHDGVESFRKNTTALNFFVPNFGPPASGISQEQIEKLQKTLITNYPKETKSHQTLSHYLSGKQAALADYRVFLASDNQEQLPYLHNFSESEYGQPLEQFNFERKKYSRSSLNYLLGLSFLKKHLGTYVPKSILEIGGGFGTLGEIWAQSGIDGWKYIDIDIPPTQFVADYYLRSILGSSMVTSFDEIAEDKVIDVESLKQVSVLCSWQIEQIIGEIDVFVNFISFQEMEPEVVANYLHHVDRLNCRWVLLRNMREGKQLKRDGHEGVKVPIVSDDYIDMLPNYRLVERNVHPFGFETVDGFHSELQLLERKNF